MRILVVSDTHGNYHLLNRILKTAGTVDLFLHAGDGGNDLLQVAQDFPSLSVQGVTGNCDYFSAHPQELLFEVGGKKIFLTHGHQYGVKRDLLRLILKGKESGAELIIFGHTHLPLFEQAHGLFIFNPGSLSRYSLGRSPSYGEIEIGPDGIKPDVKFLC